MFNRDVLLWSFDIVQLNENRVNYDDLFNSFLSRLHEGSARAEKYFGFPGKEDHKYQVRQIPTATVHVGKTDATHVYYY